MSGELIVVLSLPGHFRGSLVDLYSEIQPWLVPRRLPSLSERLGTSLWVQAAGGKAPVESFCCGCLIPPGKVLTQGLFESSCPPSAESTSLSCTPQGCLEPSTVPLLPQPPRLLQVLDTLGWDSGTRLSICPSLRAHLPDTLLEELRGRSLSPETLRRNPFSPPLSLVKPHIICRGRKNDELWVTEAVFGHSIDCLQLPWQMTTNHVASNSRNLFPHSSGG